jgi:protein transport protein SEC61 subunit alpha
MLGSCALFSRISAETSDLSAKDVADGLIMFNKVTMAGQKGDTDLALRKELNRVVPVASILGGLVLGFICIVTDILGVIGGGQGMLLATNIIYGYYELGMKERALVPPRTQLDEKI